MILYYNKVEPVRRPVERLGFGLSRELWLVEAGIFLNMLGYGAVLPFEVIYLHDGRGFSLALASLVVGTATGAGVVTAPFAGSLIDRFGSRAAAVGAGAAVAAGYAGLAFSTSPARAFAAAALAGAGNGALNSSQSTLLAALARPELRHRASAVSRVAVNSGIASGGAIGGFIAGYGITGFVVLFLANALTYVVYVGVLVVVVREGARPERMRVGYRIVVRDRAFRHLAVANVAMIGVGWGIFTWVLPPYARSELGFNPRMIGFLLFVNAASVVVAQVPIAKLAEGRRRAVMMAIAGVLFAVACFLVVVGRFSGRAGYPTLVVADVAVGVGECFYTTALMPLVAELAPVSLRGRYMASIGLSWWVGLALAPTLGGLLLSTAPTVIWIVSGGIALATAASLLTLERRLPDASRLTPRPAAPPTAPAVR